MLCGLLATTQMTMTMDPEILSQTTETQVTSPRVYATARMFAAQSGRTPRSPENSSPTSPRSSRSASPVHIIARDEVQDPLTGYDIHKLDDQQVKNLQNDCAKLDIDLNSLPECTVMGLENIQKNNPRTSLPGSPTNSPRDKQTISEVLGGETRSDLNLSESQTTEEPLPKYNGYYSNNPIPNLPIYKHLRDAQAPEGFCKITCENKEYNKKQTILFSPRNQSDETILYNKEKYIVVTNDQGEGFVVIDVTTDQREETEKSAQQSKAEKKISETEHSNSESSSETEHSNSESSSDEKETNPDLPDRGLIRRASIENINYSLDRLQKSDTKEKNTQIPEINNNSTEKEPQSNPQASEIEKTQLHGHLTSNFKEMPNHIKVYSGMITNTNDNDNTCTINFFNSENQLRTITVEKTSTNSYPTYALIKDNTNTVVFAIKLQQLEKTTKEEKTDTISKKSTSQRFNKNHGRDPKYTAIGVAFFITCVALAYKYNKLPDAFAKILDTFFAQCYNLVPTRFSN